VKRYELGEIEAERRNGYAWHGQWGTEVLIRYQDWTGKWPSAPSKP
jgi:hypothetical protein